VRGSLQCINVLFGVVHYQLVDEPEAPGGVRHLWDRPLHAVREPINLGEYKLHVSTFATTRVALLTGGAAR